MQGIKWKGRREKFSLEHERDLKVFRMAHGKLAKHLSPAGKLPVQTWQQELIAVQHDYQAEYRRTCSTRRYYPDYPCKWSTNTVCHILERRDLGHTVNFKTEKVSYKVKASVFNRSDKVAVFENTH